MMKNTPNKYHILLALLILLIVLVTDKREVKWWNSQNDISQYRSIDLIVNHCYVNRTDLSFNDSIKASSYNFELIDTIVKNFDWINLDTPFRLKKELNNDTLRLIQKDRTELKFKIK